MINLVISSDSVLVIATQEGTQSEHIPNLYRIANQFNVGYADRFHDNHGNICITINDLTQLADMMFKFGIHLGLGH